MRPINVSLFAALGMMLTSISVYSLTPPGGHTAALPADDSLPVAQELAGSAKGAQTEIGRFQVGSTLMIEGRVGHPKLARSAGETFVMLEVRGDTAGKATTQAP